MLNKLLIRNLGLIDSIEIDFQSGLTVLTGETGSGKSLIVRAIALLFGAKAGLHDIRFKEDYFVIEGLFSLDLESKKQLHLMDLDLGSDTTNMDQIRLTRSFNMKSKNMAQLNGKRIPLKLLKKIGNIVADIHAQGDHAKIFDTAEHLSVFDTHTGLSERAFQINNMLSDVLKHRSTVLKLERITKENQEKAHLVNQEYDEITQIELKSGELEELENQINILSNVQVLIDSSQLSLETISGSSDEDASLNSQLQGILNNLSSAAIFDKEFDVMHTKVEGMINDLDTLGRFLRKYIDELDSDPNRLDELMHRKNLIKDLMIKYEASSIEILLERSSFLEKQMENRDNTENQLDLEREIFLGAFQELVRAHDDLSASRRVLSDAFIATIKSELTELGMEYTDIDMNITDGTLLDQIDTCLESDNNFGQLLQEVEFMISSGKGESFRSLQKVASGGEAARLMLAFKASSVDSKLKRSLILDEIDYGIGGRLGAVIGKKLSKLSINNQIICVTHLPQLAIFADNHIKVEKTYLNDRTVSINSYVYGIDRISEITNMYGHSNHMNDTTNQLLQDAGDWKQSLRELETVPA